MRPIGQHSVLYSNFTIVITIRQWHKQYRLSSRMVLYLKLAKTCTLCESSIGFLESKSHDGVEFVSFYTLKSELLLRTAQWLEHLCALDTFHSLNCGSRLVRDSQCRVCTWPKQSHICKMEIIRLFLCLLLLSMIRWSLPIIWPEMQSDRELFVWFMIYVPEREPRINTLKWIS